MNDPNKRSRMASSSSSSSSAPPPPPPASGTHMEDVNVPATAPPTTQGELQGRINALEEEIKTLDGKIRKLDEEWEAQGYAPTFSKLLGLNSLKEDRKRLDSLLKDLQPPLKRHLAEGNISISHCLRRHLEQLDDSFQLWQVMERDDEVMVPLLTPIFGESDKPSMLMWRNDYHFIMEQIDNSMKSKERQILLAGNRGIGKSVLGLCYVLKCVRRREVVLYQRGKTFTLVFMCELPEGVKRDFTSRDYAVPGPGVYIIDEDSIALREGLILNRDIVFVQDIGDTPGAEVVRTDPASKWLLISSPNSNKLDGPLRYYNSNIYVMRLWTESELRLIQPAGFPEDKMVARIKLFGKIPRLVFGALVTNHVVKKFAPETLLEQAYSKVTMNDLIAVFRGTSYVTMPSNVAGIMVNIIPSDDPNRVCEIKLASFEMRERLVEEFLDQQRMQLSTFLNQVKDVPELGGYRGYVLETAAHRKLLKLPLVKLRQLGPTSDSSEFVNVQIPKLSVVRFSGKDLKDIPTFSTGQYARPWSRIFPTLDSFAVMPASLFFGAAVLGMCLVLIQVTMAGRHPPNSAILKMVYKRMRILLNLSANETLPVVLVFVTDPNGVRTTQPIYTKGKKGEAKKVATRLGFDITQFAMLLGDEFAELMAWENARVNVAEAEELSDLEDEEE